MNLESVSVVVKEDSLGEMSHHVFEMARRRCILEGYERTLLVDVERLDTVHADVGEECLLGDGQIGCVNHHRRKNHFTQDREELADFNFLVKELKLI